MIRKSGSKYIVKSKRTGRILGRHASKKSAERQEKAVILAGLRESGKIPARKRAKKTKTRRSR